MLSNSDAVETFLAPSFFVACYKNINIKLQTLQGLLISLLQHRIQEKLLAVL